jgi:hypothetical protein
MEAASPSNCVEADVSKLFYDVTVTGNELSLKTGSGETFSTPVAADGSVKTSFTGRPDPGTLPTRLSSGGQLFVFANSKALQPASSISLSL